MSYGATSTGFILKPKDQIILELEDRARQPEFFGPDIDLSIYNFLGAFIRLAAEALSGNWNALEANYYASYIDSAEGIDLDRLGLLVGIPRKSPQSEKVILKFLGTNYITVPSGFLVQTASGVIFRTVEEKEITVGFANVQAECLENGSSFRVTSGQLTNIVTPAAGIDSVTNENPSSGGSLTESDGDYRNRVLENVGFIKNSGAVPYIREKMLEESWVQAVFIQENDRPVDFDGMPANSLSFTVLGGTDAQVAQLIYRLKPAAVQTVGSVSVIVATGYGDSKTIKFSRPSDLEIWCRLEVETTAGWVPENVQLLITAIIKYIGGVDTIGMDSTEYAGLGIGENVIAWKSFSYMRDIP
ncbi:MAG TPA: baseplate J/gp47 family protein, partial [Leptospiraceae bacterium]|nr:baseplate J/gp47 family protein [Leptospiraceae bacterium]